MFNKMENDWPRQEHFWHYFNTVPCTYSLTVKIDITALLEALKENNIKTYPAQLYLLSAVVNRLKAFRMGVSENNEVGYWDISHPSYTIFNNETKTFSSIWTCFDEDFNKFYQSCLADIELYTHTTKFSPKSEEPENTFNISSIPWVDFTSFNLNIYGDERYLAPIFTIGKYIEENGKTLMPLAIQVHHAACDGYHVGLFIEILRDMIENYHSWLR
ncbi:type A chloramphenicol O-acetyltransferase [Pseudolactococcus plantarum]|uniref:Chloramphenicol acetyltransferase n=1 Tax=Pseudolactococcus plantarum TaxID=1365 RepID=A0A2A5RYG2_9LACT|nr:type A chloramphenicol O-acetyltransferase [Lactococcus plantarum]PCS06281.1 chloramphenicol acetyltransferase [Lactococcus plantarum]HCN74723.1 type A chloramphenicol O-acetyltransferase [Lactococcus sp.]